MRKIKKLLMTFGLAGALAVGVGASVATLNHSEPIKAEAAVGDLIYGGSFASSFPAGEEWVGATGSSAFYTGKGFKFDKDGETLKSPKFTGTYKDITVQIMAGHNQGSGSTITIEAKDAKDGTLGDAVVFTPTEKYDDQKTLNSFTINANAAIDHVLLTFAKTKKNCGMKEFYVREAAPKVAGAVTGITLAKAFDQLKMGETITIEHTVLPSDATNKTVLWTSSVPGVATVLNGVVTPVSKGLTEITAKTQDGGYTKTCKVLVTDHLGTEADPFSIEDAKICFETKAITSPVFVKGTVKDIKISTQFGNGDGNITDETNATLPFYRVKDKGETKFISADAILPGYDVVIKSKLADNNGTARLEYGEFFSAVNNLVLLNIEIKNTITLDQDYQGEWNISELNVEATYNPNAIKKDVTNEVAYTFDPATPSTLGSQTLKVTATFGEKSITKEFTVNVVKPLPIAKDTLTKSNITFAETAVYSNFTFKGTSNANYIGHAYEKNVDCIQIKKDSPSGIVSTTAGGKRIKSIQINIDNSNRQVTVYGSNTAYTGPADLFNSQTVGTKLGVIKTTDKDPLVINDTYKYIGIKNEGNMAEIRSLTVEYELYTAADLAAEIKTIAGSWDNHVATSNCNSNYKIAKENVLTLANDELEIFKTSTDNDIKSARATYQHWCDVNNDTNYYSGTIVSNSMSQVNVFNNDIAIISIIVISILSVSAIAIFAISKRRKTVR